MSKEQGGDEEHAFFNKNLKHPREHHNDEELMRRRKVPSQLDFLEIFGLVTTS